MILSLVPLQLLTRQVLDQTETLISEKIASFEDSDERKLFLPEAEVILSFNGIHKGNIIQCRKLKWLFSFSAGIEKLPFDEMKEMGIKVTNTRGIHASQMAEQTIGIMISFSRKLFVAYRNQMNRKWDQTILVEELTDKTLCIIGAGSIGSEIARRAKIFGMKTIGIRKNPEWVEGLDDVRRLNKLHLSLSDADYAVLVTPLTPETFHLIGAPEFSAMKKSTVFINISRGDTVDEEALVEALKNRTIAGAGLDVFHEEPLPPESPLWDMENVIITPHNAGISPHYTERAMGLFVESFKNYRAGGLLPNAIDLNRKY